MLDFVIFVVFSFGLYHWSKNFYNIFIIKFTNINSFESLYSVKKKLKSDSLKFGITLYVIVTLFGKTDFILSALFISCLTIFLSFELKRLYENEDINKALINN